MRQQMFLFANAWRALHRLDRLCYALKQTLWCGLKNALYGICVDLHNAPQIFYGWNCKFKRFIDENKGENAWIFLEVEVLQFFWVRKTFRIIHFKLINSPFSIRNFLVKSFSMHRIQHMSLRIVFFFSRVLLVVILSGSSIMQEAKLDFVAQCFSFHVLFSHPSACVSKQNSVYFSSVDEYLSEFVTWKSFFAT